MAELINPSNYQDFTLETIKTPSGISRLNDILRQLAQNISSDGEGVRVYQGYGTPEASVAAGIGSLYMRLDGGTDTAVYRKESGSGDTGWVAVKAPASLPLSLANGGTGVALVDPNADRILFWDDSAGQFTFLTASTGLDITNTTLTNTFVPGLTLLSTTTISAAANSGNITITAGKAYRIYVKAANSTNSVNLTLLINNDTGTNYWIPGTGSAGSASIAMASAIADSLEFGAIIDIIPWQGTNNWCYVKTTTLYKVANLTETSVTALYQGASTVSSYKLLISSGTITGKVWTYEYSGT
jgi:hypothetical protein